MHRVAEVAGGRTFVQLARAHEVRRAEVWPAAQRVHLAQRAHGVRLGDPRVDARAGFESLLERGRGAVELAQLHVDAAEVEQRVGPHLERADATGDHQGAFEVVGGVFELAEVDVDAARVGQHGGLGLGQVDVFLQGDGLLVVAESVAVLAGHPVQRPQRRQHRELAELVARRTSPEQPGLRGLTPLGRQALRVEVAAQSISQLPRRIFGVALHGVRDQGDEVGALDVQPRQRLGGGAERPRHHGVHRRRPREAEQGRLHRARRVVDRAHRPVDQAPQRQPGVRAAFLERQALRRVVPQQVVELVARRRVVRDQVRGGQPVQPPASVLRGQPAQRRGHLGGEVGTGDQRQQPEHLRQLGLQSRVGQIERRVHRDPFVALDGQRGEPVARPQLLHVVRDGQLRTRHEVRGCDTQSQWQMCAQRRQLQRGLLLGGHLVRPQDPGQQRLGFLPIEHVEPHVRRRVRHGEPTQRVPRGHQHRTPRRPGQKGPDLLGRGSVVEQQQHALTSQSRPEHRLLLVLVERHLVRFGPEGAQEPRQYIHGAQRRPWGVSAQVDVELTVREVRPHPVRRMNGQRRLAHSRRPGQRDDRHTLRGPQ